MKFNYQKSIYCCCLIVCLSLQLKAFSDNLPSNATTSYPSTSNTIFKEFLGDDPKIITLKTTLDSLVTNKNSNKFYPATVQYEDANGITIQQNIEVKVRGRSRRRYCDFPPLKLKFSAKELEAHGLRKSHKSLKLVTHCNEIADANAYVIKEYLAYKMYNLLTNNSLKVQLVRVLYQDINNTDSFERFGILIEDIDELAERIEGEEVEDFGLNNTHFDSKQYNTFALFQFMIGNEDWRIPFKRNIKLIRPTNGSPLVVVPYDFDAAGIVSTSYAKPDKDYKLQTVKQRVFMGSFRDKAERLEIVKLFQAKKTVVYNLINECKYLADSDKQEVINYLDTFYDILNDSTFLKKALPLKGRTPRPTNEQGVFTSDM